MFHIKLLYGGITLTNFRLTQADLKRLTLSENADISMFLASGTKVNINELISICNYRATHIHKAFKFELIFDYDHEGFDVLRGRGSAELVIEYTEGGMFKLKGAGEEHEHLLLSMAALRLFRNCVKKDKLLLDEEIILFSDEIKIFNDVNSGMLPRYPRGYWDTMDNQHYNVLCRYFIEFCCGFDKFTAIELKMHHIIKCKAVHIIKHFGSMYNMVHVLYPEINPWDMLFVSQGTYHSEDIRFRAITNVMTIYDLKNPAMLKSTMFHAQGLMGLLGYYRGENNKGIKALRAEYTKLLDGGIKND